MESSLLDQKILGCRHNNTLHGSRKNIAIVLMNDVAYKTPIIECSNLRVGIK